MNIKTIFPALLMGLLAAHSAQADTSLSGDVGSTGVGVHLSVPLRSNVNARVGLNTISYSYNSSTSDVSYDFKLKLLTFDAMLDYFPSESAFRVSGGLFYNGNKIDAHGVPNSNGTYTVNGHTYSSANAGNIDGNIDFRKVAPYLGIGWGNPVKTTGWGFTTDLGVMFQGSPATSLSNNGCTAGTAACAQLASDVAAENVTLSNKVHSFQYYPVVRAGVFYHF